MPSSRRRNSISALVIVVCLAVLAGASYAAWKYVAEKSGKSIATISTSDEPSAIDRGIGADTSLDNLDNSPDNQVAPIPEGSLVIASLAVNATIYMVDSTTGQILASKSVVGTHKRSAMNVGYATGDWGGAFGGDKKDNVGLAVEDACAEAVAFMLDQLSGIQWTGSVVLVKGDQVYLNRGSREGVSVGQTFSVGRLRFYATRIQARYWMKV